MREKKGKEKKEAQGRVKEETTEVEAKAGKGIGILGAKVLSITVRRLNLLLVLRSYNVAVQ